MTADATPGPAGEKGQAVRRLRRLLLGLRLLQRFLPQERQSILVWAALIGFGGALAAIGFKQATDGVKWLITASDGGYVETFRELPWWQRLVVPTAGGLIAGLVLMLSDRLMRRKATDYMEAVALGDGEVPIRPSLMRSLAAMFSISSGEAIGREGPLVQLAAVVASLPGRLRGFAPARRRLLVACGAAAGIAAAYNAPIAGAIFVAEIILGSIAMESLGPLIISSAVAALTVRTLESTTPLYISAGFHLAAPLHLLFYAALGIVCGLAAHAFQYALRAGRSAFGVLAVPIWARLALGGIIVGGLAVAAPEVTGNGQSVIRALLNHEYAWQFVALVLVLKVAAVAAAFGSGAVGGVFTPSLLVGGTTGFLFGTAAAAIWPSLGLEPVGFALVGMGAFLAAATQAPVTSILLLFEMTLQYEIMLPLMAAAVLAYFMARQTHAPTLYGDALRTGPRSVFDRPLGEVRASDVMRPKPLSVDPGARFGVVARRFLASGSRELMVVDGDGKMAGAILLADVQPYLHDLLLADVVSARDILRDDLPTVAPRAGLGDTLGTFSRCSHDILPVVEPDGGRLVGTISRDDVFLTISELTRRASLAESNA